MPRSPRSRGFIDENGGGQGEAAPEDELDCWERKRRPHYTGRRRMSPGRPSSDKNFFNSSQKRIHIWVDFGIKSDADSAWLLGPQTGLDLTIGSAELEDASATRPEHEGSRSSSQ
jgi:hypothetical protein